MVSKLALSTKTRWPRLAGMSFDASKEIFKHRQVRGSIREHLSRPQQSLGDRQQRDDFLQARLVRYWKRLCRAYGADKG